jgi:hypothetical protein
LSSCCILVCTLALHIAPYGTEMCFFFCAITPTESAVELLLRTIKLPPPQN